MLKKMGEMLKKLKNLGENVEEDEENLLDSMKCGDVV